MQVVPQVVYGGSGRSLLVKQSSHILHTTLYVVVLWPFPMYTHTLCGNQVQQQSPSPAPVKGRSLGLGDKVVVEEGVPPLWALRLH